MDTAPRIKIFFKSVCFPAFLSPIITLLSDSMAVVSLQMHHQMEEDKEVILLGFLLLLACENKRQKQMGFERDKDKDLFWWKIERVSEAVMVKATDVATCFFWFSLWKTKRRKIEFEGGKYLNHSNSSKTYLLRLA
ncbi:unnamed protein product [Dovyalis caffra]|uniref:Uncharacterized protein n=1 Tax=Dovyalis caffra TaxID=77055 RepID=A0AAV1SRI5_9ROSI|nr:unnamed protein product [Dovyalis caffra]